MTSGGISCRAYCRRDRVMAYNFQENEVPGIAYYEEPGYWRDVGSIQAYWQANMDLLGDTPACDLRNREWPIRTEPSSGPPGQFGELLCRSHV